MLHDILMSEAGFKILGDPGMASEFTPALHRVKVYSKAIYARYSKSVTFGWKIGRMKAKPVTAGYAYLVFIPDFAVWAVLYMNWQLDQLTEGCSYNLTVETFHLPENKKVFCRTVAKETVSPKVVALTKRQTEEWNALIAA